MLKVFQHKCLRRILHIFWPNKITNAELARSKEKTMEVDWPCQQNATDIYSKSSLALDPAGNRTMGTTKETWRRSVEREMQALGWSWGQVAKLAADRTRWRSSVSALCASIHEVSR